jgi:hypothetical protein
VLLRQRQRDRELLLHLFPLAGPPPVAASPPPASGTPARADSVR